MAEYIPDEFPDEFLDDPTALEEPPGGVPEGLGEEESFWFRVGYTLERARDGAPEWAGRLGARVGRTKSKLRSPLARMRGREGEGIDEGVDAGLDAGLDESLDAADDGGPPWETVLGAAAAAVAGRLLDAVPARRSAGVFGLARAGAAGAGAAVLREVARPFVTGARRDEPLAETLRSVALAGAARGLLYGGLIDPRIPGPALVRGAAYGVLEHLVSPWGGLTGLAGSKAPHRRIPFLADLFEDFDQGDDTLADHVVFGLALAALYGAWGDDD